MGYYIVTTTKFADYCIRFLTYGASQSNWLANINVGDIIFLSQFRYESQHLFGPFLVIKEIFYNKTIIYPQQRYYYRIRLKPLDMLKKIEETDLYLHGIYSKKEKYYFSLINLIQQNKHLHCISLTHIEGEAILGTFRHLGLQYNFGHSDLLGDFFDVDSKYLWDQNKLDKKHYFSSESDLESYIILTFKKPASEEYEGIQKLLNKYQNNHLQSSTIYNQFIFGNAYPSDIAVLNENNINVFELKKGSLSNSSNISIEKEIKKHLYYSFFSSRIQSTNIERFNFYLVYLKDSNNNLIKDSIFNKFNILCEHIGTFRENNIIFVEYFIKDGKLLFEEA